MEDDTQRQKSSTPDALACTPSKSRLEALESWLEALESRLAFQDDWLESLDGLVREQASEIDRLTRLTALMRERMREQRQAIDDLGVDTSHAQDELPPHY